MKKTAVFLGVLLLLAGLALAGWAFVRSGLDFTRLDTVEYETKEYAPGEDFDSIVIQAREADVVLVPAEDGRCRVVCRQTEKLRYDVALEEGALTVRTWDDRDWLDRLISFSDGCSVTVYLPRDRYAALTADTRTGDLAVPEDFTFGTAEVTVSTGDVDWRAHTERQCRIQAGTGDITVTGSRVGVLDLTVSTGQVTVTDTVSAGAATLSVSTGGARLRGLDCTALLSQGSTGRLELTDVFVRGAVNVTRSTGDVIFTGLHAEDITIETGTGDVTGTLAGPMKVTARSSTGRVRVPEEDPYRRRTCRITTSTGDITVEY